MLNQTYAAFLILRDFFQKHFLNNFFMNYFYFLLTFDQ